MPAEPEDAPQKPSPPPPEAPAYKVGIPQSSGVPPAEREAPPAARRPRKRTAVFVAHGMGQQVPFQTLDDVAAGLREKGRWSEPEARLVEVQLPGNQGCERLQRIEMTHRDDAGDECQVHVYEAYWAPLTEGRISLRDVIGFLFGAGWNGLQKTSRTFQRWLFGQTRQYEVPVRIILYLVVALLVVASLVVMNSTVLLVSAARAPLQASAKWLTDSLFADLSTTLNLYLMPVAFFALCLGLAALERKVRGKRPGGIVLRLIQALSVLGFVAVLFATVLAAVTMLALLYRHVQIVKNLHDPANAPEIWKQVLGTDWVEVFNRRFEVGLIGVLAVAAAGLLLSWIGKTAWHGFHDLVTKKGMDRLYSLLAGAFTLTLLGAAVWLVVLLASPESLTALLARDRGNTLYVLRRGISWPVLLGVSYFVRGLFVQYLGDVAVYVASHRLDRFNELRHEIREVVFKAARAVYAWSEEGAAYDEVVIVGHSLGSAVVYDALNRLVNEDKLADLRGQPSLRVVERTPLLLTFGSPLDKFAFLFALQSDSPGRQAVAATLQPLLQDYDLRPGRWINIYSPWDIISGDLDFYDPPGSRHTATGTGLMDNSKHVQNWPDPRASTLLSAHVEYWDNELLRDTLRKQVTAGPGPGAG